MTSFSSDVLGWDIGGVHTKAVRLHGRDLRTAHAVTRPFEIWRGRERLPEVLREVAEKAGVTGAQAMAVTMTAELSDAFQNKREGVLFILDALHQAFPHTPVFLLSLSGDMVSLEKAYEHPLAFAAANWLAGALFVATRHPDCVFVDVGSTTTDIIPIQERRVVSQGRTDLERLGTGELVYTGAVRTNPNSLTRQVPIRGGWCRVASEYFCVMGDVYLLLGQLPAEDYTTPTPDGRPKSPQAAAERLARLVCADKESLGEAQIYQMARYLCEKQTVQISEGLFQVLSCAEFPRHVPLVAAGTGRFLAREVARRAGMPFVDLGRVWGERITGVLPSLAVAYLLAEQAEG